MKTSRLLVAAVVIGLLVGAARAQEAPPVVPPAENVLSRIPADCLGFIAIGNVADANVKVNRFLAAIGLSEMLPDNILQFVKMQLKLTEGVNDNGGLALVLLDFAQYGWDVPKMLAEDTDGPPGPPPIAILIPGNDPAKIFAKYKPVAEKGYVKVDFGGGDPGYAKALGGYTVLTPTPAVLAAVVESPKSVLKKLSAGHRRAITANDVALYIDMKMASPYLAALMDFAVAQMTQQAGREAGRGGPTGPIKGLMTLYAGMLDFYKGIIAQMEGLTIGLRLSRSGVLIDELASFQRGSDMRTILAAYPKIRGPLLNKLPASLPYVLALGAGGGKLTSPRAIALNEKFNRELRNKLWANEALAKIPPDTRAKLERLARVTDEQALGMRLYGGGAAPGVGLFGLAVVLEVKDAATVKTVLADVPSIAESIIKALVDDEEVQKLSITYVQGAATVAGVTADAIQIDHPELADMKPEEKAEMIKVLGEAKIRLFVAAPDKNTVVVTFGGGEAFLAEALKASTGRQDLADDPAVAAALRRMPRNPIYVGVFSAKNLVDLIKNGVRVIAGPEALESEPWPMVQFSTQTPIAIGAAITNRGEVSERMFVPTATVAEAVKMFLQIQQAGQEAAEKARADWEKNRARDEDF